MKRFAGIWGKNDRTSEFPSSGRVQKILRRFKIPCLTRKRKDAAGYIDPTVPKSSGVAAANIDHTHCTLRLENQSHQVDSGSPRVAGKVTVVGEPVGVKQLVDVEEATFAHENGLKKEDGEPKNHPFHDGKLPFEFQSVEKYWPRRLLHIPTMTSVEKSGFNTYGTAREPKYSILTYIWGRFEDRTSDPLPPRLPVIGVTWKIPAIQKEYFTAEDFQRVVNRVGEDGVEWAWIDIACIDQNDTPDKTDEIGRQASIFNNAKNVFVWLWKIPANTLKTGIDNLNEYGPELWFRNTSAAKTSLTTYELVDRLYRAFEIIFGDPWFSSLWTLQEVILRNDACVLSAEGDSIPLDSKSDVFLTMFINTCQNIYNSLKELTLDINQANIRNGRLEDEEQRTLDRVEEIKKKILGAGFYFLFTDNPNVQYGIAQHRRTTYSEDRVYAIMQIYNLRVGKSIRPDDNPSLGELIDEFALAINSKCPILGQAFIHTARPESGKSWRITEASRVPASLMVYKDAHPESQVVQKSPSCVVAIGKCCPFPNLIQLARKWKNPLDSDITFQLVLDDYVKEPWDEASGFTTISRSFDKDTSWLRHSTILSSQFGQQNLFVFLLGDIRAEWSMPRHTFERKHVGLLLRREERSVRDGQDVAFERLGLCSWVLRSERVQSLVEELPWKIDEFELC